MNGEEKILELIGKMYSEMTEGFKSVNERLDKVEDKQEHIENEVKDIKKTVLTIEQEHGTKITALFDGHTLRGDQIERLQNHLDEHLDAIHTDLSYIVSKTAQHERKFIQLNKSNPSGRFLPRK